MLPATARLRQRTEFGRAVSRGSRGRSGLLVVHLDHARPEERVPADTARVGFVVNKSVGSAVVRNRVRRRLRHVVRARLCSLPPDVLLVVRALPQSATASSAALAGALERALHSVIGKDGRVTRS